MSKKKLIIVLLVIVLLVPATVFSAGMRENIAAIINKDIKITWNGQPYTPIDDVTNEEIYPIVYKDRTYLPVRYVAEKAGVDVGWDDNISTVILNQEEKIAPPLVIQSGVTKEDVLALGYNYEILRYIMYMERIYNLLTDTMFVLDHYPEYDYRMKTLADLEKIDDDNISSWGEEILDISNDLIESYDIVRIGNYLLEAKGKLKEGRTLDAHYILLDAIRQINIYKEKYDHLILDQIWYYFDK